MVALSASHRWWYLSASTALALLACGVEAESAHGGTALTPAAVTPGSETPGKFATAQKSASPAPDEVGAPQPIHRYGFDGNGTIVRDSVGAADGTVIEAQLAGDGLLRLPGTAAYVELPGGLLSDCESATLEFWLAWEGDTSRRAERIFDVGSSALSTTDGPAASDFFLSPNYDEAAKPRLQFRDQSGQESQLFAWRVFPTRRTTHVVVVLNGAQRSMELYIDGESLGSSPWNQTLAQLGDENIWLGRSQNQTDPNLSATFDEFRIYDMPLSREEIARNYQNGADGVAPSDTPLQPGIQPE